MVMSRIASHRTEIIFLLASAILAYANAFCGTFQSDDFVAILGDPDLVTFYSFISHLDQMIRPFSKATFFIDRNLYGDNPAGYHLLNLILHLGSGVLLYSILTYTLNKRESIASISKGTAALPFWTAFLFLIHPIGTETVTYLYGRATGMMAFFYLATIYFFIRSTNREENPSRFFPRYFCALLCFIFSLLSREISITIPAALLLWDIVLRQRRGAILRSAIIRFHLPFWGLLFLFLLFGWSHARYSFLFRYSLEIRPFYENLLTQVNTVTYALHLFFIPTHLNFDHDLKVYHFILQWPAPLSLAVLSGMMVIAILSVRRAPFLSFGILWFLLQISPTNSIIPRYDLLRERNLYLPSIGLFLAVVSFSIIAARRISDTFTKWVPKGSRIIDMGQRKIRYLPFLIGALLIVFTIERKYDIYRPDKVLD